MPFRIITKLNSDKTFRLPLRNQQLFQSIHSPYKNQAVVTKFTFYNLVGKMLLTTGIVSKSSCVGLDNFN